MIGISVHGATAVARKFHRLASTDLRAANVRSVEFSARIVETDLKQRRFSGNPVKVRSGITRNSIRTQIDRAEPSARVGSSVRHILVLEDGKVIRAKRAKVLTIPLRAAQTGTGRSRGTARQVGAGYDSTFWKRSKKGNLILFGVRGKRLTPLFVGKKSVRIKARRPFALTMQHTRVGVVRKFDQEIGRALR